mgnify:CR=1 FL=1
MKLRLVVLALASLLLTGCLYVPDGARVIVPGNGCASDGSCPFGEQTAVNFYWAPTREVVLAPNQSLRVLVHELCHAHQHGVVVNELGIEPDIGLTEWYRTTEGLAFDVIATATQPRPWLYLSYNTNSEDFATSCSLWFVDPDALRALSPERAAFMEGILK